MVLCLLATLCAAAEDAASSWKITHRERGITTSRRELPGSALPAFRGRGTLQGGFQQMLSVMLDISEVPHWAYGIDEARVVKTLGPSTDLVYLYSNIPWPVHDRDMIVRRDVEIVRPGHEVRIHLKCAPEVEPERKGIVRVKECESTFTLRSKSLNATELDYVMQLDPAGGLPAWASSWVAKQVPFRTLLAVEERSAQTLATHQSTMRRFAAAF